jgi:hypothetical protein
MLACLAFVASVTYQCRAVPVKEVLADLSKSQNVHLLSAADIAPLRMVIDVHDVSLDDLKAKVAKACTSKWVPYQGGYQLVLDQELLKTRARAAAEGLAKKIAAEQVLIKAELSKEGAFTKAKASALLGSMERVDEAYDHPGSEQSSPSDAFHYKTPGSRGSFAIIAQLDPYELASLPSGTSVYSDRPTRLQRQLGPRTGAILRQLAADQKTWLTAFSGDPKFDSGTAHWVEDPRNFKEDLDGSKLRCILKVEKSDARSMPRFTCWFVNADSDLVGFGETSLDNHRPRAQTPTPEKPELNQPDLIVPEDVAEQDRLFDFSSRKKRGALDARWHEILTHPDRIEPLSLATSSLLLSAAAQAKLNLVACLTDDAEILASYATDYPKKPIKLARFWRRVVNVRMGSESGDGWEVLWQIEPTAPVNRAALALLMQSIDAQGCLRLADYSAFAAAAGGTQMPNLLYYYMEALQQGMSNIAWRTPWLEAKFYGSLTQAEKKTLSDNQPLTLRTMSDAAKSLLQEVILTTNSSNLQLLDANGRPQYSKGLGLKTEPTEILAGGFEEGAMGGMTSYRLKGVLVSTEPPGWDGTGLVQPMSMNSLAIQTLIPSMPNLKNYDQLQGGALQSMVPGYETMYHFEFRLRRDLQFRMSLMDEEFNFRQKGVALEDLPQDYKDDLGKAIEQAKKDHQGG